MGGTIIYIYSVFSARLWKNLPHPGVISQNVKNYEQARPLPGPTRKVEKISPRIFASDRMLGYTPGALKRSDLLALTHPDDRAEYHAERRDMVQNVRRSSVLNRRYIAKDGSTVRATVSTCLVHNEKQNPQYFVTQVRDITERKRAEEALWPANKKLNLLSGSTRHGIKNQLLILIRFLPPEKKDCWPGITSFCSVENLNDKKL